MAETTAPTLEAEPAVAKPAAEKKQGFWSNAWRQFRRDRPAVVGLWLIALLFAVSIYSPFVVNGRPYVIRGILTNFYANDIAAWKDWNAQYRELVLAITEPAKLAPDARQSISDTVGFAIPDDAGKLSPAERAVIELELARRRDGLPKILGRVEDYLKPEDSSELAKLRAEEERQLETPTAKLSLEDWDKLASEIEDRFGALALDPAFKRTQRPLNAFELELLAPLQSAAQDLRDAKEDQDAAAIAKARARLAALAPRVDAIARDVESGAKAMALFFGQKDASDLTDVARAIAELVRKAATDDAPQGLEAKFRELSNRVSRDYAQRAVAPELQRLPYRTYHPVVDYLTPLEIFFTALFASVIAVIVFRKKFESATERLPLDPSDLGIVRLALIALPALVLAGAWALAVPRREPPSDVYYKRFAQDTADNPDGRSTISFAPVPFGENENIQQDKVSPPTWLESDTHKVERLRTPDDKLPAGVTEADLKLFLAFSEKRWKEPVDVERLSSEDRKLFVEFRERFWKGDEAKTRAAVEPFVAFVSGLFKKRLTPFRTHWLGTDKGGRDVLARVIYGSRISLSVGFVSVFIFVTIGIILGALAGYFRGWVDIVISRFTEIIMCIPSFFLILAIMAVVKQPSPYTIMAVIGLTGWTGVMRLVRGEYLRLVSLDFVVAGRALGLSDARVIFRHVLPNALAPVLVAATFGIAGAILTESSLSYLGFGVPQPTASWGSVLNEAFGAEKEMWWVTIFPGLLIFVTITAYNLVGEGFRDATDPRLKR